MDEERTRILDMLASGKISTAEAAELLDAVGKSVENPSSIGKITSIEHKGKQLPEYFRVKVESAKGDNVDIKIPFRILRTGIKLTSLMPASAADQINAHLSNAGIDLDFKNIYKEDLEPLLEAIAEMEINVDSAKGDKIRVFCE